MIQNGAARVFTHTRTCDHITPILMSLHWLPVHIRSGFNVLLMTYKTAHSLAHRTCQISLHQIFQLVHYALIIQGSWWFPGLRKSQLAAGLFPVRPPSSGITSQLTSDNLALLTPLNINSKLILIASSVCQGQSQWVTYSVFFVFYIVLLTRNNLLFLIIIAGPWDHLPLLVPAASTYWRIWIVTPWTLLDHCSPLFHNLLGDASSCSVDPWINQLYIYYNLYQIFWQCNYRMSVCPGRGIPKGLFSLRQHGKFFLTWIEGQTKDRGCCSLYRL